MHSVIFVILEGCV